MHTNRLQQIIIMSHLESHVNMTHRALIFLQLRLHSLNHSLLYGASGRQEWNWVSEVVGVAFKMIFYHIFT